LINPYLKFSPFDQFRFQGASGELHEYRIKVQGDNGAAWLGLFSL
jgi:hypothetical protein